MAQFHKQALLIVLLFLSLSLIFAKGKKDKKSSAKNTPAPAQEIQKSVELPLNNPPKNIDTPRTLNTASEVNDTPDKNTTTENTTETQPDTTGYFFPATGDTQLNNTDTQNTVETPSGVNTFFVILRMIIVLALVIAAIYGVMYVMRKSMKTEGVSDDPFLRRVSQINLGVGKSAQIITLLDKAYIVGVTDNSVNLIAQVDDKELVDAMNLYADDKTKSKKPRTFSDILKIFMPNGPTDSKDRNVYNDSKERMSQLLKKQKDRLRAQDYGEGVDL